MPVRKRPNLAGESGAELVEFAMILIALLMFLFGIMGFGHALYAYHFVSDAAREATRYAIARGSTCQPKGSGCPAGPDDVSDYIVSNAPPGIDTSSSKLTITTTWQDPSHAPGTWVRVQVSYDFRSLFPLLPKSVTMNSTSQMVISQ